jgi:hypothetical protein
MHRVALTRKVIPSGWILLAVLLGLACESPSPEPPVAPLSEPEATAPPIETLPLDEFSAQRAWADLEALSALLAPGASPDPGKAARDYVTTQLARTGLDVALLETPDAAGAPDAMTWSHVVATAPGAASDLFVLVAPLGEANAAAASAGAVMEDASGAALLLELARVISTRSTPYTTRFVWIAGEKRVAGTDAAGAGAPGDLHGSRALASTMAGRAELSQIRLLVAFDRVCREDLRVARDLNSHRVHREEFFDAAVRTGRDRNFPRNQGFESVEASHLAFRDAGVRGIAAVAGSATGSAADAASTRCSAGSLDAVGVVTLNTLDAIGRRLAKIDRFSRAPLAQP